MRVAACADGRAHAKGAAAGRTVHIQYRALGSTGFTADRSTRTVSS
jgi:hypothetical protein